MLQEDKNQLPTDRESNPTLGYKTAVHLVSLVSQEIYSRFKVMLTINGLILTAVGLIFTQGGSTILESIVLLLLTLSGLTLCWIWRGFVRHGVRAQEIFRSEARCLEKLYFDRSVRLFSMLHGELREDEMLFESNETRSDRRAANFGKLAGRVIWLFQILYIILSAFFFACAVGAI